MPNGMYGGVRGKGTKTGQRTFVPRPTRLGINTGETAAESRLQANMYGSLRKHSCRVFQGQT